MNWDDLRVFLAVARTGRVSAAARALGVEHTTVGRRLDALEVALGTPLFYRTRAGYRLTPSGALALEEAEAMAAAARAIGSRVRDRTNTIAGRVRIAMVDELATYWVAPQLPQLAARHPALELELVAGIPPLDIARGEAELAIRTPRPRQTGLATTRLGRTTFGLYAARAWLGKRRLAVDATTRDLPLLVYSAPHHALQAAPWFQPVLAGSRIVLATNSTSALLAAALAGAGVAVLPRLVAEGRRELAAVGALDTAAHDLWLVTHPEYRRDPKVRAAAELLRSIAGLLR